MSSPSAGAIRKVAIIGGGPGGTAAAKYLLQENQFSRIDVYEQRASWGGVWNYSEQPPKTSITIPQINPHPPPEAPRWQDKKPIFASPMYDHLDTNIPHTMMAYSTDSTLANSQLFPSRSDVLKYLERYAEPLRYLCKFSTRVTSALYHEGKWQLKSTNLLTSEVSQNTYDAVIVASGHYAVPYIPPIRGLQEWNQTHPHRITHSKHYRNPHPYASLKTLLIGASASGLDISSQIASSCAKPLLLSQRTPSDLSSKISHDKICIVPDIAEFLPASSGFERAVLFVNGQVETHIDRILFCTGYLHSYPFLSSLSPPPITTGERVEHLHQHIFHIPNPTLAFVGVPSNILPFPTCEAQAAVIARVWSGRLSLPPTLEMQAWETERIEKKGAGRKFHELTYPEDLDYLNEMVDWAEQAHAEGEIERVLPRKWDERDYGTRKRFAKIKRAFASKGEDRRKITRIEDLDLDA